MLDLATLFGLGEEQSVTTELVDGVVARGPREDEDDHRQEIFSFERLHQL